MTFVSEEEKKIIEALLPVLKENNVKRFQLGAFKIEFNEMYSEAPAKKNPLFEKDPFEKDPFEKHRNNEGFWKVSYE